MSLPFGAYPLALLDSSPLRQSPWLTVALAHEEMAMQEQALEAAVCIDEADEMPISDWPILDWHAVREMRELSNYDGYWSHVEGEIERQFLHEVKGG